MAVNLDHAKLRNSTPTALAKYLREIHIKTDATVISEGLLEAVASESIAPRIFSTWLYVCHEPGVVNFALRQQHSIRVRKVAIQRFQKWLSGDLVTQIWSAVGGTEGLLDLMSGMSVCEVKLLCKRIGSICGLPSAARQKREELVSDLLKALAHPYFSDARLVNPDRRPMMHHYRHMVPAATAAFVLAWEGIDDLPGAEPKRMFKAHPTTFQHQCIESLDTEPHSVHSISYYEPLLRRLPPTPSSAAGVSGSMQLSMAVLEKLCENSKIKIGWENFFDQLALPLARRAWRHKCSPQLLIKILQWISTYLQARQQGISTPSLGHKSLMYYAVQMWSRHPAQFERALATLLGLVSLKTSHDWSSIILLVQSVKHKLRLDLLRLLLRHLQRFKFELDNDDDLKKYKGMWDPTIFLHLLQKDARLILERLIKLRPDGYFIEWRYLRHEGDSILKFRHGDDPTSFLIYLSCGEPQSLDKARTAVDERKKKCITSREQVERGSWAKEAVLCSIASGSLDLYEETLLWARRFNKDALTVKALYGSSTVLTREGVDLLCGFPQRPTISLIDAKKAEHGVKKANRICINLLETACMGLREPGFSPHDWTSVLWLFRSVLIMRLKAVNKLQSVLGLSDEEVYHIVWKDTLETCLALERIGLQDGHEDLGFNHTTVSLPHLFQPSMAPLRVSTVRFCDEFARQRHELWAQCRPRLYPSVLTLPEPWTRGLPLRYLLLVDLSETEEGYNMPYLTTRAESVVFIDPKIAMKPTPSDKDTQDAIGIFIEDWKVALRFYIHTFPKGPSRNHQIDRAWTHAINRLTGPRMSESEGVRFWRQIFQSARVTPSADLEEPKPPYPVVPITEDPEQPTEWNPDPEPARYDVQSRTLSKTCLDALLRASPIWPAEDSKSPPEMNTVEVSYAPFATEVYTSNDSPEADEALIAAALLLLDGRKCAGNRVLSQPFPTRSDVRYPALYLDEEFLDRKNVKDSWSIDTLDALKGSVPPTLLFQLTRGMFAALKDPADTRTFERETFLMLVILAKSDRPQLAFDLIRELILERPQDSSWHRHMLNRGFLDSLPAKQAKEFLESFGLAIKRKLTEQSQRLPHASEPTQGTPPPPLVKITTVKMLAQTLSKAAFVEETFAADLLIDLFSSASHLDIRVAVIQSLVNVLVGTKNRRLKVSIFEALAKYAVPIAGSLNERHVMTEDDWQEAERSGELPEVYVLSNPFDFPPILGELVRAAYQLTIEDHADVEYGEFIAQIVLPVFQRSAENNLRWMALCLKKHGVQSSIPLPAMPVKPDLLATLLNYHLEHIPANLIDTFAQFVAINLELPSELARVNQVILADRDLRTSNAGAHWLKFWSHGFNATKFGGIQLAALLGKQWTPTIENHITYHQIRLLFMEQADIVLRKAGETRSNWDQFIAPLEPHLQPKLENDTRQATWESLVRPVVQALLHRLDRLRSPQWQMDANRAPAVLPDPFRLRLWLLTYPCMPWLPDHPSRLAAFTSEVSSLMDRLTNGPSPYHDRFVALTAMVEKIPGAEYGRVAVTLGRVGPSPGLGDVLRVTLAASLLRKGSKPRDGATISAARNTVAAWKASVVEDVRVIGFETEKALMERRDDETAWFKKAGEGPSERRNSL